MLNQIIVCLLLFFFSQSYTAVDIHNEVFQSSFATGIATGMIPGLGQLLAINGMAADAISPLIDFFSRILDKEKKYPYEFIFRDILFWQSIFIGCYLIRKNYEKILGNRPAYDDDYFNPFLYSTAPATALYYSAPLITKSLVNNFASPVKKRNAVAQGLLLGHLTGLVVYIASAIAAAQIDRRSAFAIMAGLTAGAVMYLIDQHNTFTIKAKSSD